MSGTPHGDREHLSPQQIAGYLDGVLEGDERAAIEEHLDGCPDCRAEVAGASALVRAHRRRRRLSTAVPLIGAAAAALLIFATPRPSSTPTAPAYRGAEAQGEREGIASIDAIAPRDGALVRATNLELSWQPIEGRPLYRVTVTNEDGTPVWTHDTEDTRAAVPDTGELRPGASYFWYVDAIQEDGRSATTGVRRFTIES